MLKITIVETVNEQTWTLHGRLAGPWVAELRSSWEKARAELPQLRCVIDLTDVTFIDELGEIALRAMKRHGAEFVARGVDTREVLAGFANKQKRPLRKCLKPLAL